MPITFLDERGERVRYAPPRTKTELQYYLWHFMGLKIPGVRVCADHSTPLDALADCYFARFPVVVWKASRGFGGKTTMMAGLSSLEFMNRINVAILGGSGQQSTRVHEATSAIWNHRAQIGGKTVLAPFRWMLSREPNTKETRSIYGNWMRALTASTKSARGPHPQRLRLDEVDEMDLGVLDAAMGQTMSTDGVESNTLISSTHQYPDGTMSEVLARAQDNGWPVHTWCFRETLAPHGWLSPALLERKRNDVTRQMWEVEYEMSLPSVSGVILAGDSMARFIDPRVRAVDDLEGVYYEFERPAAGARYATGCDWARDQDFTVILTLRTDCDPYRVVAYERVNRLPYPVLISKFETRLQRYCVGRVADGVLGAHDTNGIGAVIGDHLNVDEALVDGMDVHGRQDKIELYSDYIMAIESGKIRTPHIKTLVNEHRYLTGAALYGGGHPPDTVSAGALAWACAAGKSRPVPKKKPGRLLRSRTF